MLVNRARLSSNVRQFDETELPPRDSHGFPNFRKHAFHHLHIYVIRRDEREREREREGREKKVERKSGLIRRGITEVIEAELCKAMRQERKNWAQSRLAPRNGHAYGELWRGNNCFFAFRKPLSLSLSTHVSTLGIFLRSSYLLAGRCAAKRRNLISIKFYDCNESVAQRWRFRHATAKLSTSGPCYIARVTRFSRGNRGRIKFLWGRNGFDRKPGIGLSDRFFYSSAEGMARRWKNIP